MIYGKIWCVVRPSVGVPLMLAAVALGSFAVHLAILTNTAWLPKYLNGNTAVAAAPAAMPAPAATK